MKTNVRKNQRGDITIIVIILLTLLVLGGAVYWFLLRDKEAEKVTQLNPTLNTSEAREHLDDCIKAGGDNDICTFMTGFNGFSGAYTMDITASGGEGSMKFAYDGQGNSSMTGIAGNVINYNNATYIQSGNVWIKYPADEDEDEDDAPIDVDSFSNTFSFDENNPSNNLKDVYQRLGTEPCGNLECFKYQMTDPSATEDALTLIWFDTGEYKLRKIETADEDGEVLTINMNYDKVTISEPSPVQEL